MGHRVLSCPCLGPHPHSLSHGAGEGGEPIRAARVVVHSGFTLIEVAVVMLLITIALALVGINLQPDREAPVREEAQRLAALVRMAQQESILQGRVLAVELDERGYRFRVLNDDNEFVPLSDTILRSRPLPPGIVLVRRNVSGGSENAPTRLILLPSGELPAFRIVFARGDIRWQVQGGLAGEITARSLAPDGRA